MKVPTERGLAAGIRAVDKVSRTGAPYLQLLYPESVQKMIVEAFVGQEKMRSE